MAELKQEIQAQSFELIRDRIGAILADEIINQFTVITTNPDLNATVFVERFTAFDKSELPAINVLFSSADYLPATPVSDDGNYEFYVDVYTSGTASDGERGDKNSASKLHKLLGVCRSILRTPYYLTLGLPGIVGHTSVGTIQVMEPKNNQDATNTIWGRLVFKVKAIEGVELQETVVADGFITQVKLNLTDKGYLYEKN